MMKKALKIFASITCLVLVVVIVLIVSVMVPHIEITPEGTLSISISEVRATPDEVAYYFDDYALGSEEWTTTPEYAVDNILTNYASTIVNNQVERLTKNTCPATDLGTITKVEIRAYAYGDGDDELYIRPEFVGGAGDNHITVPSISGAWGAYQNITNDSNAPSPWTWTAVQDLECDIEYDKTGSGAVLYVSKVEIRITYSTGAPKGGSVAFVRATEGSIVNTTLTLNIEVSAGTNRVLVVGLAYKSSSVVAPTSINFNGTEAFSLEMTATDGGDAQCFMYYLTGPTETTADVVIIMPGTVRMVGYVAYFTGVDQTNPFTANTVDAQGSDATPTVDLTSDVDEIAIDVMAQVSGGPDTITSNTGTKICDGAATGGGSDTRGGGQYDTGANPVTMGYTTSDADDWNIVAGALQEPSGVPDIANAPATWILNGITGDGDIIPDTLYYANPLGDTTTPSATVVDAECRFLITNSSTMAIDLTLTMGNFAGGDANMTNSDTGANGATSYGAYSWFSGDLYANKVIIKTAGSAVGKDGLVALTDIRWGAEVETQTDAWAGGTSSTATLTITATVD